MNMTEGIFENNCIKIYSSQNTIVTNFTCKICIYLWNAAELENSISLKKKKISSKEDTTFVFLKLDCMYPLLAKYLQITFGFDNAKSL